VSIHASVVQSVYASRCKPPSVYTQVTVDVEVGDYVLCTASFRKLGSTGWNSAGFFSIGAAGSVTYQMTATSSFQAGGWLIVVRPDPGWDLFLIELTELLEGSTGGITDVDTPADPRDLLHVYRYVAEAANQGSVPPDLTMAVTGPATVLGPTWHQCIDEANCPGVNFNYEEQDAFGYTNGPLAGGSVEITANEGAVNPCGGDLAPTAYSLSRITHYVFSNETLGGEEPLQYGWGILTS
jgi:hypothetical protein